MRYYGVIHRWHDDKGYGFIKRKDTDDELFFHISDCPKGAQRPQTGWIVSFEIGISRQGKAAACNIQSAQFRPRPAPLAAHPPRSKPVAARNRWVLPVLLCSALGYGYQHYQQSPAETVSLTPTAPAIGATTSPPAAEAFRCDQRVYCSDMRSLAEARYFLQHCPGVKMDGDGDGEPCENQFATRTH